MTRRHTHLAPLVFALLVGPLAGALSGCGGVASIAGFTSTVPPQQASIAVVSLSINDYGGSLQGWNRTRTSDLMNVNAAQMLGMAEQALTAHYQVVPAPNFIGSPQYQQLAAPMPEVSAPMIQGAVMPVFGRDRGQIVGAQLDPVVASQLAQATGTDYVAVIYSEWGVATGGFVPTSKAPSLVGGGPAGASEESSEARAFRVDFRQLVGVQLGEDAGRGAVAAAEEQDALADLDEVDRAAGVEGHALEDADAAGAAEAEATLGAPAEHDPGEDADGGEREQGLEQRDAVAARSRLEEHGHVGRIGGVTRVVKPQPCSRERPARTREHERRARQ